MSVARAALLPLALLIAFVPPVAAEGPVDGTCDASGLLVCAGANVDCSFLGPQTVSCDWTYGHIWTAFSPIGLPGDATFVDAVTVEVCVPNAPCEASMINGAGGCSFAPGLSCDGDLLGGDSTGPVDLIDGECVSVTVTVSISVDARVVNDDLPLADVSFTANGGDAGTECFYDNGR